MTRNWGANTSPLLVFGIRDLCKEQMKEDLPRAHPDEWQCNSETHVPGPSTKILSNKLLPAKLLAEHYTSRSD